MYYSQTLKSKLIRIVSWLCLTCGLLLLCKNLATIFISSVTTIFALLLTCGAYYSLEREYIRYREDLDDGMDPLDE
jgi:hypothetical protein